jgi:hypothetical protein
MPKVKTVSVHYGRKLNLGDFNSATVECTVWADVDEGENLDQAMHGLWDMAKENVKAQLVPLNREKSGNGSLSTKEFFLGLPIEVKKE